MSVKTKEVHPSDEIKITPEIEVRMQSDAKLKELVKNYHKAADALRFYLEHLPKESPAEETKAKDKKLSESHSVHKKLFKELLKDPMPGEEKFQEKRLMDIDRKQGRLPARTSVRSAGKAPKKRLTSEEKKAKGILNNTFKFVKDILKK